MFILGISAQRTKASQIIAEVLKIKGKIAGIRECNDVVSFSYDRLEWQLHKSGRYAYETNEGCCATSAAWLNYIVEYTYHERGYLHFLRPDGSGHVLNYILLNGKYYIIDMTALTKENAKFAPVETGLKKDYVSSKFYTGICAQANNLMDYVNFHRRFQMTKGYEFSYLSKSPVSALSPNCSYVENGILYFLEFGKSFLLQMRNLHYESRQVPEDLKFPIEYTNDYV
ncbi:MAG: hypothetical protein HFH91_08525 [Lachnospiraceae bacterium]|nr:hypothetical protein [Lachnospiraceae bacterium]